MKYFAITFLLVFTFQASSSQKTNSQEPIIKDITIALKEQDSNLLLNCVPSFKDFQNLIKLQPPEGIELTVSEIYKSITEEAIQSFKATLDSGEKKGIQWSLIEIVNFDIEVEKK